jgi:hypothetical protein
MNNRQRQLDNEHLLNPQPGDYWHDRFCPAALVIDSGAFFVAYLSERKSVDSDHWTWDTSHVEVKSKSDFKKWLSYEHIEGTWASVVPNWKGWKEFAEEALQKEEQ